MKILIEMIRGVLCANPLTHERLVPTPCLFECERPIERVRVLHCYDRGQSPSVLTDREPLDNVEFLGVRRAEGIDVMILAAREPDRQCRLVVLSTCSGMSAFAPLTGAKQKCSPHCKRPF